MECFSFLAGEKEGGGGQRAEAGGSVIGIGGDRVGERVFFRIWGTRRVFVRMREPKRAPVSLLFVLKSHNEV